MREINWINDILHHSMSTCSLLQSWSHFYVRLLFIWRQNCQTHSCVSCMRCLDEIFSITLELSTKQLTNRFIPFTLRHFSTGSACKHTSSYLRKWFRNVVLPAPMLPSMNTVNGCLHGDDIFGITVFIILGLIQHVCTTIRKFCRIFPMTEIFWE